MGWCRLPESNWRPFHYELSILIYRMGFSSKSCIKSCIENSVKTAKNYTKKIAKNDTMNALNEDIDMKIIFAFIALFSASTFAQTTYYNNANGTPLGTAQQVGNTTYYNNANGTPLGTAQSAPPIMQQAPSNQFSTPSAPTFPTSPLFPASPIAR